LENDFLATPAGTAAFTLAEDYSKSLLLLQGMIKWQNYRLNKWVACFACSQWVTRCKLLTLLVSVLFCTVLLAI